MKIKRHWQHHWRLLNGDMHGRCKAFGSLLSKTSGHALFTYPYIGTNDLEKSFYQRHSRPAWKSPPKKPNQLWCCLKSTENTYNLQLTVIAEINAPGAQFLEAIKNIPNPIKTHRFCVLPPWKITHQNPSVLCTPPFEKSPIKTHRFCVLPPWKITHQNPSVLCTPPFEKSPIKTHRFCVLPPFEKSPIKSRWFCVLPPLKNHCFWWAFIPADTVCAF